jgi:hypothetical protein
MPKRPTARRTRTIAIQAELHDQLRIVALHQSLQQKRRITLQDLAGIALRNYLDQTIPSTSANE